MNIKKLRGTIKKLDENFTDKSNNPKGLSIIIPVFDSIEYIERCLQSLENQIINSALFEVIIILNGKFLNELEYLYSNDKIMGKFDLIVLINDTASAGAARNLGIQYAKFSHITFLDIDDFISPNFIQANYNNLEAETITISQINDIVEDKLIKDAPINDKIERYLKQGLSNYRDLNRILTITACKAIPVEYLNNIKFRENLKSGEDTVLFIEVLISNLPNIKIIPFHENAIYYREIRDGSISRQEVSFDFNIVQRIDILKILDSILNKVIDYDLSTLIKYKYNAQITMMNKFLKNNDGFYNKTIELITKENFVNFKFELLNNDLAETLMISYCAPPYSDTSSTIIAKRILEKNEIVDIVSNRMDNIRSIDNTLNNLVKPYISNQVINQKNASFGNFYFLSTYIDKVFLHYCKNINKYSKIYSRAMFPVSHLPGLFIKLIDKNIFWEAEFSDPLLKDIESNTRMAKINFPLLEELLSNGFLGGFTEFVDNNLFNLAELIPFALADKLVFTNQHQLNYMIDRFPVDLQESIKKRAEISSHPVLDDKYYNLVKPTYEMNDALINIGYFGNFYSRRGIEDIIKVKEIYQTFDISIIQCHIFTNIKALTNEDLELLKEHGIIVNDYVPYLEFLSLSKKFDILLIFDADTSDIKFTNPYLPSKFSDYLGSQSKILAVVEENSVMDKIEHSNIYKLKLTDNNHQVIINNLMEDTLKLKKNYVYKELGNPIEINHDGTSIFVNEKLNLQFDSNGWLIRPKAIPIKAEENYTFKIRNSSNRIRTFNLKSFYGMKNVINISISSIKSDYEYENCISKFKISKDISIYPQEEYVIKIKYLKDYNKKGFLNAGRILVNELG